jgi:hypothetical protein
MLLTIWPINQSNFGEMVCPEKPLKPSLLAITIPWEGLLPPFKSVTPPENQAWNLVDTDLLPRYNYAAPAKNRWGDTVYPQLPHTSALDIGWFAESVAK